MPQGIDLTPLLAISGQFDLQSRRQLFGEMGAEVARLIGAEKVIFGLLDGKGHLVPQVDAFGIATEILDGLEAPCPEDGSGLAERVVFGDEVFRAGVDDGDAFVPYRPVLEALQISDALAVSWRLGGEVLGILAALNSTRGGFAAADTSTMRVASAAAALVWKHHASQATLDAALERIRLLASAMRDETERTSAILRALDDSGLGVVVVNLSTLRITHATPAYCRITQYALEELQAFESFTQVLTAEARDGMEIASEQVSSALGQTGHGEMHIQTKSGTTVPTAWTASRLIIGGVRHSVGIVRDITSDLSAIAQIEAARKEAVAADEAKSQQLSRISHELRTPLTAIIGYTDLLLIDEDRPRESQQLRSILRAGEHLLRLIDDVLTIARIDSREEHTELGPVSVDAVVDEARELLDAKAQEAGRTIRRLGASDAFVHGDHHRLLQVILNLLSNAIKYGGPNIATETAVAGAVVTVSVTDDGPGIPPARRQAAFEPFERLGADRSGVPGTGLGLSVARRLVESMNGRIGVTDNDGVGTRFWLEMPRARSGSSADAGPVDGDAAAAARSEWPMTVLYVEDNLDTIGLVEEILARRPDVRLVTALQGSGALDLARSHMPALILLDVHLPDVSGTEAVDRLHADPLTRDIPIIMLSADATLTTRAAFLEAGAQDFVTKPLRAQDLLAVINRIAPERSP